MISVTFIVYGLQFLVWTIFVEPTNECEVQGPKRMFAFELHTDWYCLGNGGGGRGGVHSNSFLMRRVR